MMRITVLPNTDVPAYRQIYEQIAAQILAGTLRAGEALPPIRTVSREIGVSVITVRGAWDALEADGLIETRVGSGCYVAALSAPDRSALREEALRPALTGLVTTAKSLGFTADAVCERVRAQYQK
ncbi:MAG: GntR family transcriptional regulator [Clostridia bacterium]|nr:GntR family transcriptional regulator [Clostridia bacterium]